jgi:hypothetical protein
MSSAVPFTAQAGSLARIYTSHKEGGGVKMMRTYALSKW